MDNVTHALAGLLLAEAATAVAARAPGGAPPRFRRTAAVVGIVAAELPDADLLYAGPALGMGKLGYLLHHRGHTHTVLFALAAALLVWGAVVALRRGALDPRARRALLGLAAAGTLSHLALDYTNSYGVHPFWPVDNAWHYGDAVFIVEPWLWVAALPPLILAARGTAARAGLALLLVGIVAAAWGVALVGRGAALAVTVGAAAWFGLVRAAPPARRVAYGIAAWVLVEAVFFAAEGAARGAVRAAVGPATLRDAVLTPAVANPFCVRALVVEADAATYRVTAATVAPFPVLRDVRGCAAGGDGPEAGARPSPRPTTAGLRWGAEWSAPRAELVGLAATNCVVAAALRFVRVPVWDRAADGTVRFADLRYGRGGDGFAELTTAARPVACPGRVPPWVPPRADVLGPR